MAALNLNMTIPLDHEAGYIHLNIDIRDLDQLTAQQRQVIADTGAEFYAFAAATLTPPGNDAAPDSAFDEAMAHHDAQVAAVIHSTDGDVLRGVTGSRHQ